MSLKAENITKIYGNQKALNDVSFEINSGEIVGFLGPNGAGKTTMMKIITGFIPASDGNIFINEQNIKTNSVKIRNTIGYLPEHNPLYLDMYIKEYLNFTAGIYKIKNIKKRVDEIIQQTGLSLEKEKKIKELSKGYKQRVGLAAAIIHNPDILILDEPTTGLDPNQIIEIRNLISNLGKEKTVLLSTHIMQEVEAICDRVIILNNGKIAADNKTDKIQQSSIDDKQIVSIEFDKPINSELLQKIEGIVELKNINNNKWLITGNAKNDIRKKIFYFAVEHKLAVISMQEKEKSIEDVFRNLTK